MRDLESLGFEPRSDEAHEQIIDPGTQSHESFFEYAEGTLDEAGDVVVDTVIPELENYQGRWHPLGFMVYPLGVHPEKGSLRLHVWPMNFREIITAGSGIHNHAWYIASKVIAGTYSDVRFQISEAAAQPTDQPLPKNWLRVFRPHKVPGKPDSLSTDGAIVRVSIRDEVQASAGETHRLVPEDYHLPTVRLARLATTLVLDSPSFGYAPSVLIGGDRGPEAFHNPRPVVAEYEARTAKEQILLSIDCQ